MTSAAPRLEMLSDMAGCAYRLGMAFSAAAEKAQGADGWLAYFNAFDRCFFAVRVATALELRLRRGEPREAASDREALIDRPDPPEAADCETDGRDRDRDYDERDRDRETERASLPILLRTLEGVVADAEPLPGAEPAELLTLRELIAHAKAAPSRSAVPPGTAQSLRSRLAGSAAASTPPPKAHLASAHLASNVAEVLAARRAPSRATGPPRR